MLFHNCDVNGLSNWQGQTTFCVHEPLFVIYYLQRISLAFLYPDHITINVIDVYVNLALKQVFLLQAALIVMKFEAVYMK